MKDRINVSALIDTYPLADCIALLAACAPDLLHAIADDVRLHPDNPDTLKKARSALHEALARDLN